ncbi:type II toxin-antitoxin system RelE/ParE family toxin [Kingella kingae]
MHAFQKKTQRTSKQDLELAKQRLTQIIKDNSK